MNFIDRKMYRFDWWREWRGLPPPMSPTSVLIAREALKILDGNLMAWGDFNRDYEQARESQKRPTITIRKPKRYGDGPSLDAHISMR